MRKYDAPGASDPTALHIAAQDRCCSPPALSRWQYPYPASSCRAFGAFRDIADVETMIAAARTHQRAVVIGGGLLGLEAAWGLQRRGMSVTVVHLMPILMERQLDAAAAELLRRDFDLARAAGLALNRGIAVGDDLGTRDPAIYAVGECVEHNGQTFGLVAPIWEQAKICAARLAGDSDAAY